MSLTLRQFEVIRAVSRNGSVTGAATALGISQPAISMMLRDCTALAGFPLFVRRQGRLQPTAETNALLADLDRVFDGLDRVNRLVADMRDVIVGAVQVAATPTLADNLLPRAVALFRRSRPNVQITIETMDNLAVVTQVAQERVDFGLALSPLSHVEGRVLDLCAADLVCVVHPDNPLRTRRAVGPKDLAADPLISFSRSLPLGALVEQSFLEAGVPRRIAIEVNQSSVACSLVRAGAGIAVIDPFWFVENRDQGVVRLPFRPAVAVRAQVLAPRTYPMTRPARLFLGALRTVADGLGEGFVGA